MSFVDSSKNHCKDTENLSDYKNYLISDIIRFFSVTLQVPFLYYVLYKKMVFLL